MYAAFVFTHTPAGTAGAEGLKTSKAGDDHIWQIGSGRGHDFFSGLLNAAMNPSENGGKSAGEKESVPVSLGETLSRLLEKISRLLDEDGVSPQLLQALDLSEDSPQAGALEALLQRFKENLEQMEDLLALGELPPSAQEGLGELAAWLNALESGAGFSETAPDAGQGLFQSADQTGQTAFSIDPKTADGVKDKASADATPPQTENKTVLSTSPEQKDNGPVRWMLNKNQGAPETGEAKGLAAAESSKNDWDALFARAGSEGRSSESPGIEKLLVKGLDLLASTFSSPEAGSEAPAVDGEALKNDPALKAVGTAKEAKAAAGPETADPLFQGKKGEAAENPGDKTIQTHLENKSESRARHAKSAEKTDTPGVLPDAHEKTSATASGAMEDGGGADKTPVHPDAENKPVSQHQTVAGTDSAARAKAPEAAASSSDPPKVMDQIVERAALMVKEGRHEMMLELKPEVLGRLRMEISLEHHHLNVKMMAESPAARNLIQQHLPQLRAELQGQGLDVDRVDVHAHNDRGAFAGNRGTGDSNGNPGQNRFSSSSRGGSEEPARAASPAEPESQHLSGRISYFV